MRNDTSDVVDGKPCLIECFFSRLQHRDHSLFVHFLADHVNGDQIHVHVFTRDRATRSAARHEQDISVLSVAADMGGDYAMRTAPMTQDSRASAVTEQH